MGTFWEDWFSICCLQDMTAFVTDILQYLWKPRQHNAHINDIKLGGNVKFQGEEFSCHLNVLSTEIRIGLFSALIAILRVKELYANYEIIEFLFYSGTSGRW